MSDCTFPIIDFAKCGLLVQEDGDVRPEDLQEAGKQLHQAFRKYGFAYMDNHGIAKEKLDELLEITTKFYSFPKAEKMKYHRPDDLMFGGYDPVGALKANPKRGADIQESFRVNGRYFSDGPSDWLGIPDFKEIHCEVMELGKRLALRTLKALGIGMRLKNPDQLCKSLLHINTNRNGTNLKTITYPPITDDTELLKDQIRIGEHSDGTVITFLFQDEIGGLQAQNPDGEFVDVHPIPGTVVLNVGDILQYWSGHRLKSTVHRVMNPTEPEKKLKARKSIVYFVIADNEAMLHNFEFQDENENDVTSNTAMTTEEFLNIRMKQYFGLGEETE